MKNSLLKFIVLDPKKGTFYFGMFLAVLGIIILLSNLGIIPSSFWNIFWPVLLISLGIYLLSKRLDTRKSNTIKIERKD